MAHSREFLEEMLTETKGYLPSWLYSSLSTAARARAGGRARNREEYPSPIEKLALTEIRPDKIKDVDDQELREIWLRLHQWYSNAKRRKEAVENVVNAALWVKQEMERRGNKISASPLVEAVAELELVNKDRDEQVKGKPGPIPKTLETAMAKAPDEILLVRDFMSIGGSAAVTEKPNDFDVVVRANYDANSGSYQLDGSSMWVAARRFLASKKGGPQIQLLGSPAGSFTDYVPAYDLVLRRRAPNVIKIESAPPEYKDQERVIKQARAASSEIKAQGEKSKKENEVVPGRFFYQPKPTRPAREEEPQTLEGMVKLFEERSAWLPSLIQKKFDGARHQIHKDGVLIKIYSEDGDDNTERLPGLVAAVEKLPQDKLVFDAELEIWNGKQHYPREAVAAYLAAKDEPNDAAVFANVFDVLYFGDRDIHDLPLKDRLKFLAKFSAGTEEIPSPEERLNFVPGHLAKTPKEVEELTQKLRRLPGSEGMVSKTLDSVYPLDFTTPDTWIKFHNSTSFTAKVIKATRTKGGTFVYDFGISPGNQKAIGLTEDKLAPVGKSFATSKKLTVGGPVKIEAESVNLLRAPEGVQVTAWAPRVLEGGGEASDSIEEVVKQAAKDLVLQTKIVDDKGEVTEYLPANIIKQRGQSEMSSVLKNPKLVFVQASLDKLEKARGECFVGKTGEFFIQKYLEPLGLNKSEVALLSLVPQYLSGPDGSRRDPETEEIREWKDDLDHILKSLEGVPVIALGKLASESLRDKATLTLPHPLAVLACGDSGEVGRKLKKIKKQLDENAIIYKALPRQLEEGEGGTRSAIATDAWEKNWWKYLPRSGQGKFVYQHHWRGLGDDELKRTDEDLMKNSDHSVHGDFRFEGENGLWGFTSFLGKTEDNRGQSLDKIIDWKKDDTVESSPKLNQPTEWLNVGQDKPYISGPGEVGSTTEKYSKFFMRDSGTYQLGVAREHMVEIFLDGKDLKGRYLLMYAPVAGRRRWLLDKPEDQTPVAESRDLDDLIRELRQKNQRFLVWGKPGSRPQFIDVKTGRVEKALVPITKADPVKRIVYGVVWDPYGENGAQEDAHNDWTSPSEVERIAHEFAKGSRVIGLQHKKKADAKVVETFIEQYPTRKDYLAAMRGEDHAVYRRPFGNDVLHSGAWVIGVELGKAEWELFEKGVLNGFSPGGFGARVPLKKTDMPKVRFVDLEPKERR